MICKNLKYKILKGENYNTWGTIDDYKNNLAISIECSKCINCKIKKMLRWKTKLLLESKTTINNNGHMYFITLTYDNKNIHKTNTENGNLWEAQKMFKRWRKNNKNLKIKYFIVNELGEKTGRIHHHLIVFSNIDFLEKKPNGKRINKNYYYQNDNINWTNGFHSITKINTDKIEHAEKTINYVLKYLTKNPLNYSYSQKIGYQEMEKTADKDKGIFIHKGNIIKLPNYKNILPTDEIIKQNKLSNLYKSKKQGKENLKESKEIQLW